MVRRFYNLRDTAQIIARLLDKSIAYGLGFTVLFTCLAFGTVEAWSVAVFEVIVLTLLALWAVKFIAEKKIEIRIPPTALPIAAFLVYVAIQGVTFTDAGGKQTSLSYDPETTRQAALVLFFLLATHLLAANFFLTRERLRYLAGFLTVFGTLFAFFALVQYLTWNNSFYWLRATKVGTGLVTGSFVNHNNFAGYMALLAPLPAAMVFTGAVHGKRFIYGFASALMYVAAIAALSRGGTLSLMAGVIFLLLPGLRQAYNSWARHAAKKDDEIEIVQPPSGSWVLNFAGVLVILVAVVAGIFLIGSQPVLSRVTDNSVVSGGNGQNFENARGWIWKNSLTMFRANPVFGVGLGGFETAFPKFSDGDGILMYGAEYRFDRAHNDYLQVLTDTGIIGGVIALWFLITLGVTVVRNFRLSDRVCRGFVLAGGAAAVSLAVHSFFDFNLQIPAIAVLFMVLAGVMANLKLVDAGARVARKKKGRKRAAVQLSAESFA